MSALAILAPVTQYFDLDGDPLDNGKLYFGVVGQNPETNPIPIYWDAAATQPAAQPIRTKYGYPARNGSIAAIYSTTDYSMTVRDKRDRLVFSLKNSANFGSAQTVLTTLLAFIASLASSAGAGLVGFIQNMAGAVQRTVLAKLRERVTVLDFGADPTGVADSKAAFQAACDGVGAAGGGIVWVPRGTYKLVSKVTIPANVIVQGEGRGATTINAGANVDLFLCDGWNCGIRDVRLDYLAGTYTGRPITISTNTNYLQFQNLAIYGFNGYAVEHLGGEAGKQTTWFNCEFKPQAAFQVLIKMSDTQDVGAGNRRIIACNGQGGILVDFGGSLETFVQNCFSNGFINVGQADLCTISLCRVALVGSIQAFRGNGFLIGPNYFPGPVVFRSSGTVGATYNSNEDHSFLARNSKYCKIYMQRPYEYQQGTLAAPTATGNVSAVTAGDTKVTLTSGDPSKFWPGMSFQAGAWASMIEGVEVTTNTIYLSTAAPSSFAGTSCAAGIPMICDGNTTPTTCSGTAGTNVVTVASAAGLVVGRLCYIQNAGEGGDNIMSTIIGISGTTVTLAEKLGVNITGQQFTAQGTPLALGTGGYCTMWVTRSGATANIEFSMLIGSGASLGGGTTGWTVWMPWLAHPRIDQFALGSASDVSAGTDAAVTLAIGAALPFFVMRSGGQSVRLGWPFTWAAGDIVQANFQYTAY